jgi:hypothetical protein
LDHIENFGKPFAVQLYKEHFETFVTEKARVSTFLGAGGFEIARENIPLMFGLVFHLN